MSFWTHLGFYVLFGIIVSLVVSGFREEDPRAVLRGTAKRLAKFTAFAAVLAIGILALEKWAIGAARGPASSGITVYAGKKSFSLDKAPADFPAEFRSLIESYQDYATAHGIVAVCAPPLPVVFFTAGTPAEANKLFKEAEKLFASLEARFGKRKKNDLLPVFILKKTPQYEPLVQSLVAKHAYLSSWATGAKDLSGFFLLVPPIVVVLQDGVKQEEFQLENQVLHQLVHVELGLQTGATPFWLAEGIAWVFEEELTGEFYSFCYRDGFVFASEHRGWLEDIRKLLQKKQFPAFEQIVGSGKSSFDRPRSLGSYGLARFLLREKTDSLREAMESYAREHKEKLSQEPNQDLPLERQKQIFAEKLGADFEAAAQKYLATAKSKG